MSSFIHFILFSSLLLSLASAQQSFRPRALLLPVSKDPKTQQFLTEINQRTPLVPTTLVVSLGGRQLWVDCYNNFISSSIRRPKCGAAQCALADADGCRNNICGASPENPVTRTVTYDDVVTDVVNIISTDGSRPGPVFTIPNFVSLCAPSSLLEELASDAVGSAGLGRTRVSLSSQLAARSSFKRQFAMCLPSSTSSNGVIIFGDVPYKFLPNVDASKILAFTPILTHPSGDLSAEYFIGVKKIKINGKVVPIATALLTIQNGGTQLTTGNPNTVMRTSIYNAVTSAFIKEAAAMNITRVASVAPFGACFDGKTVLGSRLGAKVPFIDLVLQNEKVVWTITGSNSMVEVGNNVLCLGFVDGGKDPRIPIIIGTHQLEDNVLQFDLATSRLGFSNTLLARQTTCANFNFTLTA
ncbi:putative aspartic proteinase GIP2 [Apium graveolens]|uniref:putative aspartic proteinase GIP2 n=1 Tax=Apium graveolens TaxID=4045 RepID=UPI003D791C25